MPRPENPAPAIATRWWGVGSCGLAVGVWGVSRYMHVPWYAHIPPVMCDRDHTSPFVGGGPIPCCAGCPGGGMKLSPGRSCIPRGGFGACAGAGRQPPTGTSSFASPLEQRPGEDRLDHLAGSHPHIAQVAALLKRDHGELAQAADDDDRGVEGERA